MNEDQLGAMWRDVVDFPTARILQVTLDGSIQTTEREERGQGKSSLGKIC